MQSILQYRRFGRHLKAQYERERSKVHELAGCEKINPRAPDLHTTDLSQLDPAQHQLTPNVSTDQPDTARSRDGTERLGKTETKRSAGTWRSLSLIGTPLGKALTGIQVRRPTTREGGGDRVVFVVGFQGEKDSLNPHNWSSGKRWVAT
jgi:hypothetical protein